MELLKEIWEFRKGDIHEKVMFYVIAACVLVLLAAPIIIYLDKIDMAAHHCVKTERIRESSRIQYIYGDKGQIISAYPVHVTESLYTCDDFARWR